eukprot:15300698-Ditylum_brightwellii.AAC.1
MILITASHLWNVANTQKIPSFEALKNEIHNPKLDSEEKKAVAFARNWDSNHDFRATKVRATIPCDSCGAP